MSRTSTYTCDRCGAVSVDNPEFLSTVAVGVCTYREVNPSSWIKAEWCDDCVDRVRSAIPGRKQAPDAPPPPTLEDLIREIVSDEVWNAIQNR